MPAKVGQEVGIYVDLCTAVELGDVIETQSGRRYLVSLVRVQERGKHAGRQHLRCVVLDVEAAPPVGTAIHRIRWYPRKRRASTT